MNLKKWLVAGLVCGVAGMIFSAENLIRNPEFELSTGSGLPKNWNLNKNAIGEVVPGPENKNAISLTGPEAGKWYYWMQHGIRIEAGKKYLLKGKFKAAVGTQAEVYLECTAPWKDISSGIMNGNGEWQTFRIKNISFVKIDKLPYLVCRVKAPGAVAFAELGLTEEDPNSIELVRNDDFIDAGQNGLPKYWTFSPGCKAKTADDAAGRYLVLSCPPNGKSAYAMQRGIKLEANKDYLLTVSFKGPAGSIFEAYLETSKPSWQVKSSKNQTCSGKWQTVSFRFSFTPFTAPPYLVLSVKGNGDVLIRGLKITDSSFPLNGDFKNGTENWTIQGGSVIHTGSDAGNVLELNSATGPASAVQHGIPVKKGQYYELSWRVCGGTDKTHRDSQNAVWFRVSASMDGKRLSPETWLDSFDTWQTKSVLFTAPKNGKIDILLEAQAPYCVDFDQIKLTAVNPPEPPLVLLPDPQVGFRNGVYSSNRHVKKAKYTLLNNTVPQATAYEISFNGGTFRIPMKQSATFELDIPAKPGMYPVRADALSSEGKVLSSVSLPLAVNPPAAREVTFREDHVMLIDGKPFFPLGVWAVGGNKSNQEKAKLIAEAGFNTAAISSDLIDDFAEHGMMAIIRVLTKLPQFKDASLFASWDLKYRKTLKKSQNHPSMVAYFSNDEPAWGGVSIKDIQAVYEYFRKIDPYRPVWIEEAPRGEIPALRHYAAAADIYSVDIYPVPEPNPHSGLDDKNMTCVGKYVDRCREIVYDRKPVWITLQGFSWNTFKKNDKNPPIHPTEHQNRFMAYNAVAHGATGLFWYGICQGKHQNWDFVAELGKTIWELRKMTAVFVAETVKPSVLKSSVPEVNILHKKMDGVDWFIAVNESNKDLTVELSGAGSQPLNVFFENRKVVPVSGVFRDSFKAYDVHIYSTANELPPPLKTPETHRIAPRIDLPENYRDTNWIWYPGKNKISGHKAWFKREITLAAQPQKALFFCAGDDCYRLYVNGRLVMEGYGWNQLRYRDLAPFFKPGKNTLLFKAADGGKQPCGLLYSGIITEKNGKVTIIKADSETMASEDNKNWFPAEVICKFGDSPWGSMGNPHTFNVEELGSEDFPF